LLRKNSEIRFAHLTPLNWVRFYSRLPVAAFWLCLARVLMSFPAAFKSEVIIHQS